MICVLNTSCYREVGEDRAQGQLGRQNVPDSPTSDYCSGSTVSSVSSDCDGAAVFPREPESAESAESVGTLEPLNPVKGEKNEGSIETFSDSSCKERESPQEVSIGRACRRPTRKPSDAEVVPTKRDLLAHLQGWKTRRVADGQIQFVSPRRVAFLTREEAVRHARATCWVTAAGIDTETFGKVFDTVVAAACDAPIEVGLPPLEPTRPGVVRVRLCVGEPNVLDLHFSRPAKGARAVEKRRRTTAPKAKSVLSQNEEDEEDDRLNLELNEILCDINNRTLEDDEEDDFALSPVDLAPPETARSSVPLYLPRPDLQNTPTSQARPCPASKRKTEMGPFERDGASDGPPPGKRPRPASLNLRGTLVCTTNLTTFRHDFENVLVVSDEAAGLDEVESPQEPLRSVALSPSDDLLLAAVSFDFENEVPHADSTVYVVDAHPPLRRSRSSSGSSRTVSICLLDVFNGAPLHLFNCCGCSKVYDSRDSITFNSTTKTMNRTCAKCFWVTIRTFEMSNREY